MAKSKEQKRLETLEIETEKQKKNLVSQLKKTPIVQIACEKTGVGRSTYYKWRSEDVIFGRAADHALEAGRFLINDLAESKLISLIQESNVTALIFWLKSNHPKYVPMNKVIHEYEFVSNRLSVEEESAYMQRMLEMRSKKLMPKYTAEEMKEQIEGEFEEAERNAEKNKRLESFEDDPEA